MKTDGVRKRKDVMGEEKDSFVEGWEGTRM